MEPIYIAIGKREMGGGTLSFLLKAAKARRHASREETGERGGTHLLHKRENGLGPGWGETGFFGTGPAEGERLSVHSMTGGNGPSLKRDRGEGPRSEGRGRRGNFRS